MLQHCSSIQEIMCTVHDYMCMHVLAWILYSNLQSPATMEVEGFKSCILKHVQMIRDDLMVVCLVYVDKCIHLIESFHLYLENKNMHSGLSYLSREGSHLQLYWVHAFSVHIHMNIHYDIHVYNCNKLFSYNSQGFSQFWPKTLCHRV